MKVKILLIPLFLLIAVLVLIWVVAPQFSIVKERYIELSQKKADVEKTQEKIATANSLKEELERSQENKEVVENFLPGQMEVEEIIDNLNYIAATEGVSIATLSLDQPEKSLIVPGTVGTGTSAAALGGSVGSTEDGSPRVVTPIEKVVEFNANYGVIGEYTNVKNVISKLYRLKRFNRISKLNIEKINPQNVGEGENQVSNSSLKVEMEIAFTYLAKESRLTDIDNQVFSRGSFSLDVLPQIDQRKTLEVLETIVPQSGKANPFLP